MKRFAMITTTILVWGIPLIVFFGVANGEIQNDPYKNDTLYNRYADYGKKWMYFPDGDGKPTIVFLERDDNMVLPPENNLKAANDDLLYVQFMLYTRKNQDEAYILNYDDKENLENSAYDPSKHTKFVTHGWRSSGSSNTCQTIKNGFLEAEDVNVVVVDWEKLARFGVIRISFFHINQSTKKIKMAVNRLSLIKTLELVIVIICVILHYKSYSVGGEIEYQMLITGTFCGYLIILIGDNAVHYTSSPGRKLDVFYSLVGAALFIASGYFSIKYSDSIWNSKDTQNFATAKGYLAIANGILFLVDSLFTWRD